MFALTIFAVRKQPVVIAAVITAFGGLFVFALGRAQTSAVAKHFGEPVPASVSRVLYRGNEFFGLVPEPSYHLRFLADPVDVEMLLKKGLFRLQKAGEGGVFGPSGAPATKGQPPWWRLDESGGAVEVYARETGKPCVIEWLWWDRTQNTVFYFLSCP